MKKIKEWKIKLIKKYAAYIESGLTYNQMAELCGAPSDEAIRSFIRRHDSLQIKSLANVDEVVEVKKEVVSNKKMPKILIFDIESSPLKGYFFQLWRQNISINQLLNSGNYIVLSWAAKWLFADDTMSDVLTPEEVLAENDFRIVQRMWTLLDEADIVVAHWGSGFDVPMMNGRFMMLGLNPPSPFMLVDTKVHAAKAFKFPSNKLDYLAQQFGVGKKIKTDFTLWERCMRGDKEALSEMDTYCIQDTNVLHDVYLLMRPWIKPHPNVGLFIESDVHVCPTCGSEDLKWGNSYYTQVSKFEAFTCNNCGSHGRSRTSVLDKNVRKSLVISLPK